MSTKRIFRFSLMPVLFCVSMQVADGFAQVQEAWVQRYDGPEVLGEILPQIAINNAGSVFIAGTVHGSANADLLLIKYGASGSLKWKQRYDRGIGDDEEAEAMAMDAAGNIYLLAELYPANGCSDFLIIKYDGGGSRKWVSRFDGSCDDVLGGMKADADGNVYVWYENWLDDYPKFDTGLLKYDIDGKLLWRATVSSPFDGRCSYESKKVNDLTIDQWGNVYVTGYHSSKGCSEFPYSYQNYLTCKYDAAGQLQWTVSYDGGQRGQSSVASTVAIDNSGNAYVTGSSIDDIATIKYSPSGSELWVQRFDRGGSDGGGDIDMDADGKVYVAGSSTGEAALIKYDAAGNQEWARFHGGAGSAGSIVIDNDRNVYLGTGTHTTDTGEDYFTIKYDALGDEKWSIRYNNAEANGNDKAGGIAVHTDGSVYRIGASENTSGSSDWTTVKYVQTGSGTPIVFNPSDDAYVKSSAPTSNFGTTSSLRVRKSSSEMLNAYLKFNVAGSSGAIKSAVLRLYVTNAGNDGGSVYFVSNNYLGTSTPWTQDGLNWNNSPPISGTVLSSAGAVSVGQWVELDVKSAITGNGIYSFGIKNSKSDVVYFTSKEGDNKPELAIQTGSTPALPSLSINDASVAEGNGGTVNAIFTASLSTASNQTVTVNVATADGTAQAGSDYQALTSTLLAFPPMTTSQPVTVLINGDLLDEADETFFVNLSDPTNATVADNQGAGTIVDDDVSGGVTLTFTPTNDAYVKPSSASANFGSVLTLRAPKRQRDIDQLFEIRRDWRRRRRPKCQTANVRNRCEQQPRLGVCGLEQLSRHEHRMDAERLELEQCTGD